mmetsp:Transcript_47719/g.74459  ORF Transcript_47719/g.74459 Transcript_47719/m.74459 type:complete len:229 (+) Transcript_47719:218-904(+)|eukprot:CAMPEP_0184311492 /NCGR_PEP_ID=MMETSP1049-20130417/41951_1 /TAXON_ID=77928 /ORGANISM="Proteomonas sulcata, Strain CCMP704" /LENGTH=228 /DNA_ID=CAMNT_0026626913 /DNA_START=211 /DNA_END=897 /DNA_ORIENTATION=-
MTVADVNLEFTQSAKVYPRKRPVVPDHLTKTRGKVLTLADLAKHFNMPQHRACEALGICSTSMKKLCRKFGVKRWPYSSLQCAQPSVHEWKAKVEHFFGAQKLEGETLPKLEVHQDDHAKQEASTLSPSCNEYEPSESATCYSRSSTLSPNGFEKFHDVPATPKVAPSVVVQNDWLAPLDFSYINSFAGNASSFVFEFQQDLNVEVTACEAIYPFEKIQLLDADMEAR